MRRADRLFEILQMLRGGRLRTASEIAEALEVSTRTIWRDVADLQAQGVPVAGERGVGYVLQEGYFLPPLGLTGEEMEALLWGVHLVGSLADDALAQAARELQVKILAVSPEDKRLNTPTMAAYPASSIKAAGAFMAVIRDAIRKKHKLSISYRSLKEEETNRVVRPLNLEFWGQVWTLSAWCEARSDFRLFRCDRMIEVTMLLERFRDEPGKRFADLLAKVDKDKIVDTYSKT
ncbi:helix-turn-helix transcriptional regulator [Neokomagataea anthophila]|uniref:YafY family transcriptional regulator n=1 Tax=Neokomagataea anthophila TaxID=2826925 RepID=A0ABS5E962_9PROT|nr:YafY family protein [Neokomagataea anthophila]MBR0560447.1 YafY family transcriptional regulator [Neokomagataea anthophila]